MKFPKIQITLGLIGATLFLISQANLVSGFLNRSEAHEQNSIHDRGKPSDSPEVSTEAFHITRTDGTKSIAQLIREQSTGSPQPRKSISSIHILVDAGAGDLVLANVEGFQPPGFQIGIKAGQDKQFKTTKVPLKGIDALEFLPVRTDTVCNFLLILEFFPD